MKKLIIAIVIVVFISKYLEAIETKSIFIHYCGPCHGETGKGDGKYYSFDLNPKPRDFTNVNYMKTLTDEQIRLCITNGSFAIGKSNLCPPWGKTILKEKIDKLVNYIRSFSQQQKVEKKVKSKAKLKP